MDLPDMLCDLPNHTHNSREIGRFQILFLVEIYQLSAQMRVIRDFAGAGALSEKRWQYAQNKPRYPKHPPQTVHRIAVLVCDSVRFEDGCRQPARCEPNDRN